MRKKGVYFLLLLFVVMLCACRSLSTGKERSPVESSKFQFADSAQMDPGTNLALATVDVAKLGALKSFPYARISSQSKINLNNKTDYYKFIQNNMVITDDIGGPDETRTLGMVCESIDHFGRIDLSKNRIIYKTKKPDKKEAAAIRKSISQGSKLTRRLKDKRLKNDLKEKTVEYQRAKGLTPDGIAGRKTIESLSQELSMIDVQELTTQVVYPQKPRISAYIVRSETLDLNPGKFNKGFKSINEVKKHALSMEEFKSLAKPGETFVVFIYFLDRIDPAYALKWGLAGAGKSLSKTMSPIFYADPETWPVIVETISIDKETEFSKLYVNLFKKRKFLYSCIASYEIK